MALVTPTSSFLDTATPYGDTESIGFIHVRAGSPPVTAAMAHAYNYERVDDISEYLDFGNIPAYYGADAEFRWKLENGSEAVDEIKEEDL
jgi:hypothetical protein